MKLKILLVAIIVVQLGFGQERTCGVKEATERMMFNPVLKERHLEIQKRFEEGKNKNNAVNRNGNNVNSTIYIPVAVHYPSAGSANATLKNCLRNLAQNQINILNADYNANNSDINLWTDASAFYPGVNIGDMDVQFVIATQNHPSGTGLVNGDMAVTFGTDFLFNADSDATWSGYMNIVVRNISGGILGYSPLGGLPGSGMTVVIDNNAFGSGPGCTGFAPSSPYNLGRTLTHELGHFFNLDHTFASCDGPNCATSGDLICDTPSTNQPEFQCLPNGSLASPCTGNPQLTMNYMDYGQDACLYMFTQGQASRMTAWYNAISSDFLTNKLSNNDFVEKNFSIYPNPNNGTFSIELKEYNVNYTIQIYDSSGRLMADYDFNNSNEFFQVIKLDNVLSGIYFVTIKVDGGGIINKKIVVQ
jgi:hypothetical protein